MPNTTIYLDDKNYIDFNNLPEENKAEIRKKVRGYMQKLIYGSKGSKK